jgi:hypothetical protein
MLGSMLRSSYLPVFLACKSKAFEVAYDQTNGPSPKCGAIPVHPLLSRCGLEHDW